MARGEDAGEPEVPLQAAHRAAQRRGGGERIAVFTLTAAEYKV